MSWWSGLYDLKWINKTYISLIPRIHDPQTLSDFRPINCCNVIYKTISKLLANRLKPFLNDIISVNQSAFIPRCIITDNALVAFKTFHVMKRKRGRDKHYFALKLDMSKAYDKVAWGFLERIMLCMSFSDCWVRRIIISCISSVSFAFRLNRHIFGHVSPTRGIC